MKEDMNASLFVTDLDGTLLRDDKTISQEDMEALGYLKAKGVVTAIATGRSLYSLQKVMAPMGFLSAGTLPFDYIIFSTGAGIMTYPGCRILKKLSLGSDDVVDICDCFDRMKLDYMVHCPIPDTNKFVYKSHGDDNPDFFARIQIYMAYARQFTGRLIGFGPATQILSVVPGGKPRAFMEVLANDLKKFSMIQTTSPLDKKSLWIEVFHKKASKSQAVCWLSERLGILREKVAAVGNDYNDEDLLEWSGTGYVVENAPPDLKNDFIPLPSNNHNAVSEAVENFLGQKF